MVIGEQAQHGPLKGRGSTASSVKVGGRAWWRMAAVGGIIPARGSQHANAYVAFQYALAYRRISTVRMANHQTALRTVAPEQGGKVAVG